MASKETQELIIEALDFYMSHLGPDDKRPSLEVMRKLVKLDDIRNSLINKEGDE